jgi:hypothetical protein
MTMDARMKVASVVMATVLSAGAVATSRAMHREEPQLSITLDAGRNATITLSGIDARALDVSADSVLALYTEADVEKVSIAGDLEARGSSIVFRPYYPLEKGIVYVAIARVNGHTLREIVGRRANAAGTQDMIVSMIYPTADTLPENLLRFYVQFSRPMVSGDAAPRIELLDENGARIDHAFLANEQELWDATRTRLTVLLDPGRIKRGLKPNVDLGSPLRAGRRYTLRVNELFDKTFVAASPNRSALRTEEWKITAPRAGTLDPIVIRTGRSVDVVLGARLISVRAPNNAGVPVQLIIEDGERTIRLVSKNPWLDGSYHVVVGADLEDVSGNNLRRPFDVDLSDSTLRLRDDLAVERIAVMTRKNLPAGSATCC